MNVNSVLRYVLRAIATGVGYGAVAAASIHLIRSLESGAYPWPANAVFLAYLCRTRKGDRVGGLIAIGIAMTLVISVLDHAPLEVAAGLGFIVVLELWLGVWLLRDVLKLNPPHLNTAQAVKGFLAAGVTAPILPSLLTGLLSHRGLNLDVVATASQHWRDAILMFAIFAPPVLFLSAPAVRKLWTRGYRLENAAFPVVLAFFVYFNFRYVPFPFVTLVVPLLVAAYRQGPLGVSIGALLAACEVIFLWIDGIVPPFVSNTGTDTLASLPLLAIASTVCSPIALALTVNEARKTRRQLINSERATQEIIDRSPNGIGVFPYLAKGGVLNAAFLRMLGREGESGMLIASDTFMDPGDLEADRAASLELVAGIKDAISGRRRYFHKSGRSLVVQVNVALIRDSEGHPQRWVLQAEDIDERLRAEARVLTERKRMRVALESVGDGVLITDPSGLVVFVNEAARRTLQLPAAQVVGKPLDAVLLLTDAQSGQPLKSLMPLATVRGEKVTRQTAAVLHAPDGTVRYVRETLGPLSTEEGVDEGWIMALHDVTETQLREGKLRERAEVDAVTGLANRHAFMERLEKVLHRSRTFDAPSCLLMIDLDRFKLVNDTGGHAAGDKMLQAVTATIGRTVRASDMVARIGGDEFAVILERCEMEQAEEIATRVVAEVESTTISVKDRTHRVGASIGISDLATGVTTAAEWMGAADGACYQAKHSGRGRVCRASPNPLPVQ